MNDRFKFRIWDKIHNRFLCIDNQKRIIFDYEDKEIRILEDEENACWLHIPFDECIILQCTGLKDKNGKLIYEGDVINIWCKNFTKNQISEVKFCEERAAFTFDYITDFGNIVPCTMDKTEIEVIGNIYENKSLLESEG